MPRWGPSCPSCCGTGWPRMRGRKLGLEWRPAGHWQRIPARRSPCRPPPARSGRRTRRRGLPAGRGRGRPAGRPPRAPAGRADHHNTHWQRARTQDWQGGTPTGSGPLSAAQPRNATPHSAAHKARGCLHAASTAPMDPASNNRPANSPPRGRQFEARPQPLAGASTASSNRAATSTMPATRNVPPLSSTVMRLNGRD